MKRFSLIALLLLGILCTGCTNQYFTVDTDKESFHGAFISRDLSHGDVQMQNESGDVKCAGVLFINEFNKTKDDNNRRNRVQEKGSTWELSVLSNQFFYKHKTALKNKV